MGQPTGQLLKKDAHDRRVLGLPAGDNQVLESIAVEVPRRDRARVGAGEDREVVDHGQPGRWPLEMDPDAALGVTQDGDVVSPVAVEVGDRHRTEPKRAVEIDDPAVRKRAIPLVEHANFARERVLRHDIVSLVAVDVARIKLGDAQDREGTASRVHEADLATDQEHLRPGAERAERRRSAGAFLAGRAEDEAFPREVGRSDAARTKLGRSAENPADVGFRFRQDVETAAQGWMDPFDPVNQPNGVSKMDCTIDGRAVTNLWDYREKTDCFTSLCLPPNNVFGIPPGTFPPEIPFISCGYWLMIEPMSPGEHVIEYNGVRGDPASSAFEIHLAYEFVVNGKTHAFRRGDLNNDQKTDLSDAIHMLGALFLGLCEVRSKDAADADDSGGFDLTDPIYTLSYLFLGGPALPAPGIEACGSDPTADDFADCSTNC